mmetsp:Transcript_6725/g.15700  ORF Transcript_6725/g.15700 Transcript_6725/m.15700 type:complete len:200 (-) Transcript_6725:782-1381(-)
MLAVRPKLLSLLAVRATPDAKLAVRPIPISPCAVAAAPGAPSSPSSSVETASAISPHSSSESSDSSSPLSYVLDTLRSISKVTRAELCGSGGMFGSGAGGSGSADSKAARVEAMKERSCSTSSFSSVFPAKNIATKNSSPISRGMPTQPWRLATWANCRRRNLKAGRLTTSECHSTVRFCHTRPGIPTIKGKVKGLLSL